MNIVYLIYFISMFIWIGIGLYYLVPMDVKGWPTMLWIGFSLIFVIVGCLLGIIV